MAGHFLAPDASRPGSAGSACFGQATPCGFMSGKPLAHNLAVEIDVQSFALGVMFDAETDDQIHDL